MTKRSSFLDFVIRHYFVIRHSDFVIFARMTNTETRRIIEYGQS